MKPTELEGWQKSDVALLNTDNHALAAYKKRKRNMAKVDELDQEVSELRRDIREIKELLKKLVE